MQTGNLAGPEQKSDGCCAGEAPGTPPLNVILGMEKGDAAENIRKDVRVDNVKNVALKAAEPNRKCRLALEKQCEAVKDIEETQNRSADLGFITHLHPLSNLESSTTQKAAAKSFILDAGNKKDPETSNVAAQVEPATIISIVSNRLLQTAESLTRGDRSDRAAVSSAVAPAVSSAVAPAVSLAVGPSGGISTKQEENNVGDSGEVAQTRGVSSNSAVSDTRRILPSGNTTTFAGNSLSPNRAAAGLSAAGRRISFFAEPSKAATLGPTSPQTSPLPSSHIPVSIVSERTKQFERGIAWKGAAIEIKSRSLDPPYTFNPVVPQAVVYERLDPGSQPLSAGMPGCAVAPLANEGPKLDISGKDSVILSPECVWMRRASQDRFDGRGAKNNSSTDDMVLEQRTDENSMSFCTPLAKTGNIQKLKSFFGETTPKIIEAKGGGKSGVEDIIGEAETESKKDSHAKCEASITAAAAQKSLTFDPASWALERMARGKKAAAWTRACRSHSSHAPGNHVRHKKSSTDREPSSSPKQKEHKTWKGKVADTFKRYGSGTAVSGAEGGQSEEFAGTFGVPLELLPPSLVSELVPSFVEMCTHVVEEKGLDNQGIYRVPGNTGALNAMIEELNKDPHGLCMESEKWQDINLVSSMLKMFLRKLPDPLITDELYEAVIVANRIENSERRMLKLKKLIHDLPEHNFETLRFLAQHLNKIASHEEVNKMDAHNLSIVFGPTLVRPQDDTMVIMVRDMADQCRIVESVIVHCDWFFSSWDEDVYVPVDEETEDAVPISGMNQELLAKAERLAFPRLPRDIRCKEIVSSFLHAANRKIRKRKSRKDFVTQQPIDQVMTDEFPVKRFKRSENRNSGGNLKRYLSERKITTRTRSLMLRSFRSHGVLREAPSNLIQYPISSAVENACGMDNAKASTLCRTLSLECLNPIELDAESNA